MLSFSKSEIRNWLISYSIWLLFAFLIAPQILAYIYNDLRPPFIQELLEKYPEATMDYVNYQWLLMASLCSGALIVLKVFIKLLKSPKFQEKVVGESNAETIGAIRALVCLILLMSTIWEDLASTSYLPREFSHPIGVMNLFHLLPFYKDFLASYTALKIFEGITALLLTLGMLGIFTRKVLPFAAFGYLILAGTMREYAWFYHTGLIPLLVLFVLNFTPCDRAWSLDALFRKWKTGKTEDSIDGKTYGWARYAIWMVVAIPYFAAGLSKIRNGGLFWWNPINFKHSILYCDLRPMEFDFDWGLYLVNAPDFIFAAMGLIALLGEILYVTVLFSKWGRLIFPLAMLLMHFGILFLQNILFFDLIFLQVIFWNLSIPKRAVSNFLIQKLGKIKLNYKESSLAWSRGVLVIKGFDLFDLVDCEPSDKETALVTAKGKVISHGTHIIMTIMSRLPLCWLLYPILYIIAVTPAISSKLYSWSRDVLDKGAQVVNNALYQTPRHQQTSSLLSRVLITTLVTCWVFRLEIFPLTAMQMFSKIRHNVVRYEVVKAHMKNGEIVRAPIRQSIGAMACSRYRRVIRKAFESDKGEESCGKLMHIAAGLWNAEADDPNQILKMEVQRWTWDFVNDRDNESYGNMQANRIYEIQTP